MRPTFVIPLFLAALCAPGIAQERGDKADEAAAKARVRVEGAAGGTGQGVSEEARRGADAGAGPHLRWNTRAAPRDQSKTEGSAAAGGTVRKEDLDEDGRNQKEKD